MMQNRILRERSHNEHSVRRPPKAPKKFKKRLEMKDEDKREWFEWGREGKKYEKMSYGEHVRT